MVFNVHLGSKLRKIGVLRVKAHRFNTHIQYASTYVVVKRKIERKPVHSTALGLIQFVIQFASVLGISQSTRDRNGHITGHNLEIGTYAPVVP